MLEENIPQNPSENPRRRPLFAAGIVVGILAGAALTMLLIEGLGFKRPTVVKILDTPEGNKDTVVNYVVHQYVNREASPAETAADTLDLDSLAVEEDFTDFMLDEEEAPGQGTDAGTPQTVTEDRLLKKLTVPLTYFDDNRRMTTTPAGNPSQWQVQQWSTPIRNRQTYHLSNNVLKIQGMDIENLKIVHYEGRYYLLAAGHTYAIKPNKQYDKLLETEDVGFLLK